MDMKIRWLLHASKKNYLAPNAHLHNDDLALISQNWGTTIATTITAAAISV